MKTLLTLSLTAFTAAGLALPAQAGERTTDRRGAVAASTYVAEKVESSAESASRQTAKRVVIVRDPDLRQVTAPKGRSLAANPSAR